MKIPIFQKFVPTSRPWLDDCDSYKRERTFDRQENWNSLWPFGRRSRCNQWCVFKTGDWPLNLNQVLRVTTFKLQMIAIILPSMILEIFTAYAVWKISANNLPIKYFQLVDFSMWVLFLVVPKNYAIYVAAKTAEDVKRLSTLVEKFSSYCSDESVTREVCLFYWLKFLIPSFFQQMKALSLKMHIRPIILSCGLFNIDWTLVLSIFGTIGTYMIIICQFENDLDSSKWWLIQ